MWYLQDVSDIAESTDRLSEKIDHKPVDYRGDEGYHAQRNSSLAGTMGREDKTMSMRGIPVH